MCKNIEGDGEEDILLALWLLSQFEHLSSAAEINRAFQQLSSLHEMHI